MPVSIKICGVTDVAEADAIASAGVDAIGMNFVSGAARRVPLETAAQMADVLGDRCIRVGVFVNPEAARVAEVLNVVALDWLQFHGDESQAFCTGFDKPYLKAIRMTEQTQIDQLAETYFDAQALLLDAYVENQAGGTGHVFDWSLWPDDCDRDLILSGGLTPDNVALALQQTGAQWVDLASGVEGAQKGRKDLARVRQFVDEVQRWEQENGAG